MKTGRCVKPQLEKIPPLRPVPRRVHCAKILVERQLRQNFSIPNHTCQNFLGIENKSMAVCMYCDKYMNALAIAALPHQPYQRRLLYQLKWGGPCQYNTSTPQSSICAQHVLIFSMQWPICGQRAQKILAQTAICEQHVDESMYFFQSGVKHG